MVLFETKKQKSRVTRFYRQPGYPVADAKGPTAFRLPITRGLALSWKKTKNAPLRHGDVPPGALFKLYWDTIFHVELSDERAWSVKVSPTIR